MRKEQIQDAEATGELSKCDFNRAFIMTDREEEPMRILSNSGVAEGPRGNSDTGRGILEEISDKNAGLVVGLEGVG